MARRAGSADLPLHGGRVPRWLAERMTRLGTVIAEAIVLEYGRDEFLRRLAHPFWFQSFGAVMGTNKAGRSRSATAHFEFDARAVWSDRALIHQAHSLFAGNVEWRETSWPDSPGCRRRRWR